MNGVARDRAVVEYEMGQFKIGWKLLEASSCSALKCVTILKA